MINRGVGRQISSVEMLVALRKAAQAKNHRPTQLPLKGLQPQSFANSIKRIVSSQDYKEIKLPERKKAS